MPSVAVIIPFYQRRNGLLEAALASIFAQTLVRNGCGLDVIVIDDCSPADPHDDLVRLDSSAAGRVRVIALENNAGPAAARNAGLEAVRADTDFVAFLDSDEVWVETHLERGVAALADYGSSLYFSNYLRSDWDGDRFAIVGLSGDNLEIVCPAGSLARFRCEPIEMLAIRAAAKVQTCIIRWRDLSALRFEPSLRIGEDSDYIATAYELSGSSPVFSTEVETIAREQGVNISQNFAKDPVKEIGIRFENLRYFRRFMDRRGRRPELRAAAKEALGEAREAMLSALLGARGPLGVSGMLAELGRVVRVDGGFPLWALRFVFRRLLGRFRRAAA